MAGGFKRRKEKRRGEVGTPRQRLSWDIGKVESDESGWDEIQKERFKNFGQQTTR
jgi:hypothetical protein